MHVVCVIPARIGSERLPSKPLCLLAGEPLIRSVARRVMAFGLAGQVLVATDDQRVVDAVAPLGIEGVLTDPGHSSGTERVAEVSRLERFASAGIVLNVQGDEPFVSEAAVRGALGRVECGDPVGTAAAPLTESDLVDRNRVKVAVDSAGHAVGFSRCAADLWEGEGGEGGEGEVEVFRHIGVYAYRREALLRWADLPPVTLEREQGLEQIRPLAYGMPVSVVTVEEVPEPGIDTEEDLAYANAYMEVLSQRAV